MGNCKQIALGDAVQCLCGAGTLIHANPLWKLLPVKQSFCIMDLLFQQLFLELSSGHRYGPEKKLACQPSTEEQIISTIRFTSLS